MKPRKIIIDTDIGDDIDDALAIALALNSPELEILGITTVYRNTSARTRLVRELLNQYERTDIPVYTGIGMPIIERVDTLTIPDQCIGLTGYEQDEEQMDASDFIIKAVQENPDLTIAAIGPQTNLAVCFLRATDIMKRANIVAMGGNITEVYAEWNILCDPEAARIVADLAEHYTMFGLNVTNQCRLSMKELAEIRTSARPQLAFLRSLIDIWLKTGYPITLHDPLVIQYLFDPSVVTIREMPLAVELSGTDTRGITYEKVNLFDPHKVEKGKTLVGISVDKIRVVREFMKRVFK